MKLIKLTNDHYIIVDDSEIDYDSEPYLLIKDDYETYIHKHKGDNKPTTEHYKITHSTPNVGGFSALLIAGVKEMSLQEVKELIDEVDVEKKALEISPVELDEDEFDVNETHRVTWIDGYTQALEDNKERKYTEEDMKKMFVIGGGLSSFNDTDDNKFKYALTHIQPKTEWEVEFVDGKLKLKS